MKKVLLLIAMMTSFLGVFAQTSIETALPLQEGVNSYTSDNSSGSTIFYTYTAPEEQSQLLSLTFTDSSVSSQLSLDGTYNTQISGIYTNNYTTTIYPVKANQTVYLMVSFYGTTAVSFTATFTNAEVEGGATCDDAIALSEQEAFIPSYYDTQNYSLNPAYLTYTCEEDGVLEMHASSSISNCDMTIGCEGETIQNIVFNSAMGGKYVGKATVEAGNTYIFKLYSYSPVMMSATLTHSVKGSSCDFPYEGAETNTLPKEPGIYWYAFDVAEGGFLIITSENSLAGGTLSLWSSCMAYEADASIDGYFALRARVYGNTTYYVCIEKNEATAQDETFSIQYEPEQAGDSEYNPIEITGNTTATTPQYNGTYYYSITIPEGDNRFLVVDATNANINNSNTLVSIHEQYNTYTALASGNDYAKAEVAASAIYLIKWVCHEGYNAFPFTVSLNEIAQGESCNNPLTAVEGYNDLADGSDKYYTYTATQDGWLVVDTDVTIDVTFLRGCTPYDGTFPLTKIANINKTQMSEGETCIIKFANIDYETSFFISEEKYKDGESCETAIAVEIGTTQLSEQAGSKWFKYTATQDGMLTISSDIIYEQSSDYTRSSSVIVKTSCDAYGNNITQSNADGTTFNGDFAVTEGDIIYINVVTLSVQTNKSLILAIRDLNPGEACSYPIHITTGEITLPIAGRNSAVWYTIALKPGEFTITSSNYEYFSMYLFDSCEATVNNNYLATSQYDSNSAGYTLKYNIEKADNYLLKLDGTYNPITVKVSGNSDSGITSAQHNPIIVTSHSIIVTANNQRTDVAIYDISGNMVAQQAVYDQATFTLERGIYIVKVGDKVTKVAIR